MKDEKVPIEYILYGQYIKYKSLDRIVELEFDGNESKTINIFIDAYQVLLPLYKFYTDLKDPLVITSCLINMCIHYRNYFYKYGVHTHIFLLYSPTMSTTNTRFCPEYNSSYSNRILANSNIQLIVDNNISLIKTVIPYLKDIYFKQGSVETTVMAYDLIDQFAKRGYTPPNVFITSSQYAFQLPAVVPNTVIFFKKRNKLGEDLSYSANCLTTLNYFISEAKNKAVTQVPVMPKWLSGFMTLAGIPKRDIKSLFNYRETLKILNSIQKMFNDITPEVLYDAIVKLKSEGIVDYNTIANRFHCIDLIYQLALYRTLPESQELSFLDQYEDPIALNDINNTYFKTNPLMLDKL